MIQYEHQCKADETSDWFKIKHQNLKSSIELQTEMSNLHASCQSKTSN